MRDFISIDIETGNPKRVSACAIGFARVVDGKMVEALGYLIKPVGGHAPFQSKIHGITDEHTFDKPDFAGLYPQIRPMFGRTLVAHSLFDQQVLRALSEHFALALTFDYIDTSALAKQRLPHLDNHRLKTLAKHYGLPKFRHHDAKEDAIACAHICLRLHEDQVLPQETLRPTNDSHELRGMITGILADDDVNYKEAYELLYWLEDRAAIASQFQTLHSAMKRMLEDERLDSLEAEALKRLLMSTQSELAEISSG
jgi:DNA polymerase III subunit epsilon